MASFKELIITKRKEIEQTLAHLTVSSMPPDLEEPIGRLSRMDAIRQQQMAANAKRQAEITLEQIKAALRRIDEGSYGICLKCDDEIKHARLRIKPETPFCIRCQSA